MSADSRSAQKWKGMVIGMDKKEAAQKLMSIFGNVDAIAVLHSVLVGISKYIIIVVFAVYTWHCFTVFIGKNMERKEEIYRRQKKIMFTIHFICSLVLFEQSVDKNCSFLWHRSFLVLVDKAYSYVYQNLSKLVMNNMLMLLTIGFLMIERLNMDFAMRQMIFASVICVAGLFIPWMIERFSYFDRFGWWYAGIGLAMLALVFVIGVERYGAKNWIQIGGFAMQPSEFVKIIFFFFFSALLQPANAPKNPGIMNWKIADTRSFWCIMSALSAIILFTIQCRYT